MRVTEEEAKEKLCPLIQRNCVGKGCMAFVEAGSEARFQEGRDRPDYYDMYRCGMAHT